jgi:pyruvate dehydrogenase phosphatase
METLDLTVDHGVENAREVERMMAAHPNEEDTLLVRGRVLGGLQPTRAFGDARYKYLFFEYAIGDSIKTGL